VIEEASHEVRSLLDGVVEVPVVREVFVRRIGLICKHLIDKYKIFNQKKGAEISLKEERRL
jgi:hypothetical protein